MDNLCEFCPGSTETSTRCDICEFYICDEHNYGGLHSSILVELSFFRKKPPSRRWIDNTINICPNCYAIIGDKAPLIPELVMQLLEFEINVWKQRMKSESIVVNGVKL